MTSGFEFASGVIAAASLYITWLLYQRAALIRKVHELVDGFEYVEGEAMTIVNEMLRYGQQQRQAPMSHAEFAAMLLRSQAFRVAVVHEELQHRVYDASKLQ